MDVYTRLIENERRLQSHLDLVGKAIAFRSASTRTATRPGEQNREKSVSLDGLYI